MTLACRDVTLRAGGRVLCRDLTFSVAPGEVWGVLGPNGAGKSTLLNVLAGLTLPASGVVLLEHQTLASMRERDRARKIGLLPQHEEHEFWGSALDYVLLARFAHAPAWLAWQREDETIARDALREVGLAELADRRYVTLSGGERQRARFAQLIAQAPNYLLLDEPLQHLDLRYQIQLLNTAKLWARERQKAVVLVLHDVLWPARVCTHALLLDDAAGARSGVAQAVLTQSNLEGLFGCTLQSAGSAATAGFVPAI